MMRIIRTLHLKKADIALYVLYVLFAFQIIELLYINLTQMKYHIGYDASVFYLRALEVKKQGKLFLDNFVYQTSFFMDSPVPLAALLLNLTGEDVFVAYGLSNLVIVFITLYLMFSILKLGNISDVAIFIALNIYLCPHLSPLFNNANDLGYFSTLLTSDAAYSVRLLLVLVFIKNFISIRKSKTIKDLKIILFSILTLVCFFLQGVSTGYHLLAVVIFPCFMFGAIELIYENDFKVILKKRILILLCKHFFCMVWEKARNRVLSFLFQRIRNEIDRNE